MLPTLHNCLKIRIQLPWSFLVLLVDLSWAFCLIKVLSSLELSVQSVRWVVVEENLKRSHIIQ